MRVFINPPDYYQHPLDLIYVTQRCGLRPTDDPRVYVREDDNRVAFELINDCFDVVDDVELDA